MDHEERITNLFNLDLIGRMVPLKFVSNFWRTFEMALINYEFKLDLH